MKIFLLLALIFSLEAKASEVGPTTCKVSSSSDASGDSQSFRSMIEKTNQGTACKENIFFAKPVRIELNSPLILKTKNLLITGYDLSAWKVPLGVVIDGRSLDVSECLFIIKDPLKNAINGLTLYVQSSRKKAICDQNGQSLLDSNHPEWDKHYQDIRVCRGDGPNDCDWPEDSNEEETPQWQIPIFLTDSDGDGLLNNKDRCDNKNPEIKEVMKRNHCFSLTMFLKAMSYQKSSPASEILMQPIFLPREPDPIRCSQEWNFISSDSRGNACDEDWDNDSVKNWEDDCPLDTTNQCKPKLPPDDPEEEIPEEENDADEPEEILDEDKDQDGTPDIYDLCKDLEGQLSFFGCPENFCFVQINGKIEAHLKSEIDQDGDGVDQACDAIDLPMIQKSESEETSESNENTISSAGGCNLMLR